MTANGKTVLLVEDNEDNRIVYSTILRHFGYAVTEALNGEEGIAKAMPKSASQTSSCGSSRIFSGLISQWTTCKRII